jgi:murein tripeptide amidase MpaA
MKTSGRSASSGIFIVMTHELLPLFTPHPNPSQIEDYISFLAQSTHLNVRKLIIGKSYEGRDIYALTISRDETFGNQPVLFIDAGIHAR